MSFWPPLPAPGTGVALSQDTFANTTTPLSVVGGGGPGPTPTIPANLSVSTLTTNPTGFVSTICLNGVSSINGASYPPAAGSVSPNLLLSTLTTNPTGFVSTVCLNGVSSINGASYPPAAGSVSPNLLLSTLTTNPTGFVSTVCLNGVSSINGTGVSAFTGAVPANLGVSSLTVNDNAGFISTPSLTVGGGSGLRAFTLATDVDAIGRSARILFNNANNDNEAAGQLQLLKTGDLTAVGRVGNTAGLAVAAYSTIFGAFQPLACGDLFLYSAENDGTNYAYTLESKNTPISSLNVQAPNVNISSLIGVSSINGVNWAAIVSTLNG